MSTTYRIAKEEDDVHRLARELIEQCHDSILLNGIRIDYVLAFAEVDPKTGGTKGFALKKGGVRQLGITRKLNSKDRAKGMGEVEIVLDGDWWEAAPENERRALLDHELQHVVPLGETDESERPKVTLRQHDYEFGWFRCIAERHGAASQECLQMSRIIEESGQYLLPGIIAQERGRAARLEVNA